MSPDGRMLPEVDPMLVKAHVVDKSGKTAAAHCLLIQGDETVSVVVPT